jgi:integrase-like protein
LRRKDLARDAPTVGFVADRFLNEHVEARRKPATQRLYRLAIDRHIRPALGTVAVADVSSADVVRLHHRLRPTRVMANRVLAVLRKLMNWAEHQKYRKPGSNPCRGVEKYREQARRRYRSAPARATHARCLRDITVSIVGLAVALSRLSALL